MRHQLRGASAESLSQVLGAVDAVKTPSADLAAELFAAVGALDATPALRRILTDPSTDVSGKKALVADVFRAFSADAREVIDTAVAGRWASTRDLPDGLETAGVATQVAVADGADELDRLETELFEIGRVVRSDAELRGVISDRSVPAAAKATLLTNLFSGKVTASALALATQAAAARIGSFEKALTAFGLVAADRRNRLVAEVRVARALDDATTARLAAALAKKYGRDVHLNVVVDPAVLGGLSVTVGDEVVDGSMSNRLETARRQLAG